MQIKIDVNVLQPSLSSLVEEKLIENNLPTCFGNMIPPLLKNVAEFEDKEVISSRNAVPVDEIIIDDVSDIVIFNEKYNDQYVLSEKNVNVIQAYKRQRATIHVNQLILCSACKYQEICYKLTKNYLTSIALEERI